jgi:hypothetical protein
VTAALSREVALVGVPAPSGDGEDRLIGPRQPAKRVGETPGAGKSHHRGPEVGPERATQVRHIDAGQLGERRAARRVTTRFRNSRAHPREPERDLVF